MRPISFSQVNSRKLALQSNTERHKISYQTVANNLSVNNLLLFIESNHIDMDRHCKDSFLLYDRLLKESEVSDTNKRRIEHGILANLPKVDNIDGIHKSVSLCDAIEDKYVFFDSLSKLESCDRVIRNESKLSKRFDLQKTINENIMQGCRHTVFELCSLVDTYSMTPRAKLNVSLENVLYALFKSGHDIDLNEATEYIVEYFLTRDAVITDKEYNGYINVLENNNFIDSDMPNISYVFEASKNKANSFTHKASVLVSQCETKDCASHMSKLASIKTEDQASKYIDTSVQMIVDDNITKNDSLLLLKSIYCLPLIGNISKQFVNYKLEMSREKAKIKRKLTYIQNEGLVRKVLDDGDMIDYANFISESVSFNDYILDDNYLEESSFIRLLESGNDKDHVKEIIDTFKASNEKSPSKFKNMMTRIMTKSPSNIIEGTPSIFAAIRMMMYLGIAAAFPLGPVFAALLALVNKLITMHLDLKEAEKLLRHLRSEKDKAEKKLEKLSGEEEENQEEYIKTLDKCIEKVEKFISDIDDENDELMGGTDDGDIDFDDSDFDINFESVIESGSLLSAVSPKEVLETLPTPLDKEILSNIAVLFENCSSDVCNEFYSLLENMNNGSYNDILENRGMNRIELDKEEPSLMVQYEATYILNEAFGKNKDKKKKGEKFNLATFKMMMVNFRQKFRDLRGKEQELWRSIDISVDYLSKGVQKALTSDRREAIIKGSIIPSFSKCIKSAIAIGAIGAFVGPVGAAITAVGALAASSVLNERERRLLYDEIDTELQVVEKQIQLAEGEGDMNQYRFLLNYQKKLSREKLRIKYRMQMSGRNIPDIKRRND